MTLHRRYRTTLFALAFALLGTSAYANDTGDEAQKSDYTDTIKRSYRVEIGGTLFIDIDHGNIEIGSTNENAVLVELERTVVDVDDAEDAKSILEDHEWDIFQTGDDVTVKSRFERERNSRWNRWGDRKQVRIHVTVRIPRSYNVNFESGAGNIEVDDIVGEIDGRTGAGNIVLGYVNGAIDLTSGAGNIEIDGAEGRVEVNTGAGNIKLNDVHGEIRAQTGAGNITAYIDTQPEGNSRLESGAGNVTVYLDREIRIDVDAVASLGSASTDFPLRVEGKWMHKSFSGSLNGGGPALRIRSGVGNVSLKRN